MSRISASSSGIRQLLRKARHEHAPDLFAFEGIGLEGDHCVSGGRARVVPGAVGMTTNDPNTPYCTGMTTGSAPDVNATRPSVWLARRRKHSARDNTSSAARSASTWTSSTSRPSGGRGQSPESGRPGRPGDRPPPIASPATDRDPPRWSMLHHPTSEVIVVSTAAHDRHETGAGHPETRGTVAGRRGRHRRSPAR